MAGNFIITVRVEPDEALLTFKGRDAWALQKLIKTGETGLTPLDTLGPRWSGYVHHLRKAGLVIETIHESHRGPFPGTRARYVLRSDISVMSNQMDAA